MIRPRVTPRRAERLYMSVLASDVREALVRVLDAVDCGEVALVELCDLVDASEADTLAALIELRRQGRITYELCRRGDRVRFGVNLERRAGA